MTGQSNIHLLLRSIKLVDLLAHFGKRVDHVRYMYYSPFREEDKPSMRILKRNGMDVWVDYGAPLTEEDRRCQRKNHGGGLIDMAMELGGISKKEAVELLMSLRPGLAELCASDQARPESKVQDKEYGVEVLSVRAGISNRTLLDYAVNQRSIPRDILDTFCSEVSYRVKSNPSRKYVKIGFPNNEGGWVLRGSRGKIATCSAITTIDINGDVTDAPSSSRAFVFEGFFDFLSWMAWSGGMKPSVDACILNSVSNLHRAAGWLSLHREVGICFDNDDAGRKATQELKSLCPDVVFHDCSGIYREFNDLNEHYVDRCRRRSMERSGEEPPSKGMKL